MKRSHQIALVLMAPAPFFLAGCDNDTQQVKEGFYTSVPACVADGNSNEFCQRAYASAQKNQGANGSTFNDEASCRAQFGDRCDRRDSEHGSVWMPMLEGFMLAQVLRPNFGPSYGYASPVYRLRDGQYARSFRDGAGFGGGSSSSGTSTGSGYSTVTSTPNRAITTSRSGFGSSAAARGSWGSSSSSRGSSGGSSSGS